jgi:uncharacterized protein YbjT (DUF2867 family)
MTSLPQDGQQAPKRLVTVFGGTGFLGRRVVGHLVDHGFRVRVAVRHPEKAEGEGIEPILADVTEEGSVAAALAGAEGAVNAVSLYVEKSDLSFHAVHVQAARRVARLAGEAGVRRLVHVSGIGSDPAAASAYIRERGRGEIAVREAFPAATVVRPSVMFGPDDVFLTTILQLARLLPVYPLFGHGLTRLQPVHVEDVGEAVAGILGGQAAECYELAGPTVRTYRGLVEAAVAAVGARTRMVSMPFPLWSVAAGVSEVIPGGPLSRGQVALMRRDNVASGEWPGLPELGIVPQEMEPVIEEIAARMKRGNENAT